MIGKHQNKLSILKQFNIKIGTITDHKLEKDLYDLVVESVGRKQSETLQESIDLVKPKGTILVFGVYAQGYVSKIEIRALFYKEVTLIGSNSYTSSEKQDDFLEAINFLSKNTAVFEKIISKIISLQELPEYIFKLKIGGPNNSIKTIVEI